MDVDLVLGALLGVLVVVVFVVTIRLGVVDWRTGRLPNSLMGALAAAIGAVVVVEALLESRAGCRLSDVGGVCAVGEARSLLVSVLLVAAGFAGPLLAMNLVSPASMGFGDVKLAAVLSGLVGVRWWSVLPSPLFVGVGVLAVGLTLGLAGALVFRRGEERAPLGPGLIVGVWLVLVVLAFSGVR